MVLMTVEQGKTEIFFLRKHLGTKYIFQRFSHFKSTKNKTKKPQSLGLSVCGKILNSTLWNQNVSSSSEGSLAHNRSITWNHRVTALATESKRLMPSRPHLSLPGLSSRLLRGPRDRLIHSGYQESLWRIIKERYRWVSGQNQNLALGSFYYVVLGKNVIIQGVKGLSSWEKCSHGPSSVLFQLILDLHLLKRYILFPI